MNGRIITKGKVSGAIDGSGKASGAINAADRVYVRELRFANHYEFPSIGEEGCLYIAIDENATYRYDKQERAYFCVGRDPTQIEAIQVRLKE